MNWFFTVVLCVVVVELALRLPLAKLLQVLAGSSRQAMRVISSKKISDHWKEKVVGAYAQKTFLSSLKMFVVLFLIFAVAILIALGFDFFGTGFSVFLMSWAGLGFSVIAAGGYFYARKALFSGSI